MCKSNNLFIIGGGYSLKEKIKKGLWGFLKDKFTIGCNFSYKHFTSTIQTCIDAKVYNNNFCKDLKDHPSIICQTHPDIKRYMSNTKHYYCSNDYRRDINEVGVYSNRLCGLFALSLGIHLLDKGNIFLLGFDNGSYKKKDYEKQCKSRKELDEIMCLDCRGIPLTHYYQGEGDIGDPIKIGEEVINRNGNRGIGKINYYEQVHNGVPRSISDWEVYKGEKKCKVFNVSEVSKINAFDKISYEEMVNR